MQASAKTHINNCLTVEFNPLPRFLFHNNAFACLFVEPNYSRPRG